MKTAWEILEESITQNGARKVAKVSLRIHSNYRGSTADSIHMSQGDLNRFMGNLLLTMTLADQFSNGKQFLFTLDNEREFIDYEVTLEAF